MAIKNNITLSVEIFPPNSETDFTQLNKKCIRLNKLNPDFFSVTFGASGSHQEKTQNLVRHLLKNGIKVVPHISCVNMTQQRMSEILDEYMQIGIKKLVVIRGDQPSETNKAVRQDFSFASDLVSYIRKKTGNHFYIIVAAYPEFHPQAKTPDEDLFNFKKKIDSGADCAITQYFFNTDAYFRFIDCCERLNINIPIIPGILPITDYLKLCRFSNACGAEIPLWLRKRLEQYSNNTAYLKEFGLEVTVRLCERLLSGGVKKLHFYTINQAAPTILTLKNLDLLYG